MKALRSSTSGSPSRMSPVLFLTVVCATASAAGCHPSDRSSAAAVDAGSGPATPVSRGRPKFEPAPAGDVADVVRVAAQRVAAEGRRLVVYEGAAWCEPCTRFHEALTAGELDKALPGVTFLEFDADRDRDRLGQAGHRSQYIPLFALPDPDGRASSHIFAGGVKGDGVIPFLTKRLKLLLGQGA